MKKYQSFEDIEIDLRRLSLERKIALEEMKLLKSEFQADLKPANWISSVLGVAGKYSLFLLAKRFFK